MNDTTTHEGRHATAIIFDVNGVLVARRTSAPGRKPGGAMAGDWRDSATDDIYARTIHHPSTSRYVRANRERRCPLAVLDYFDVPDCAGG